MPKSDSIAKSTGPAAIHALVEKFAEHSETYHRTGYNETLLRSYGTSTDARTAQ